MQKKEDAVCLLSHRMRKLGRFARARAQYEVDGVAAVLDAPTATGEHIRREHARLVQEHAGARGGTIPHITCRGIRPTIRGVLAMNATRAEGSARAVSDNAVMTSRRGSRRAKTATKCLGADGEEHGGIVHEQMEMYVDAWRATATRAAAAAAAASRQYTYAELRSVTMAGLARVLEKKGAHVDPCLGDILDTCEKHRWTPLVAEYMVYDARERIATKADFICVENATRKLVVVELKTSKTRVEPDENEGVCWSAPQFAKRGMPPPLVTELLRHTLQVLGTARMIEAWGINVHRAVVVHVAPLMHPQVYELDRAYAALLKDVLWERMCVWRREELESASRRRRRPGGDAAAAEPPKRPAVACAQRKQPRKRAPRRNARQMRAKALVQW